MFAETAWSIAWRQLRAARGNASMVVAGVALGIAAFTGVRGLSAGLEAALRGETRALLAADLSIRLLAEPTVEQWTAVRSQVHPIAVMLVTEKVGMAISAASPQPHIVALKAVDPREFPFYGELITHPHKPLAAVLDSSSALVSPGLLARLGVSAGDIITLSGRMFRVAGTIVSDPTQLARIALLAEILISREGMERTGLLEDTPALHHLLLRLPQNADVARIRQRLEDIFPDGKVLDFRDPDPGVMTAVGVAAGFFGLTGALALLLAALGVASAIRVHIRQNLDTIAIMKCLGARRSQVIQIYSMLALSLALPGSIIGAAFGRWVSSLLAFRLASVFSVAADARITRGALWEGLFAGLLVTAACVLMPLWRAGAVRPWRVLHRSMGEFPAWRPRWHIRASRLPVSARHGLANLLRPGNRPFAAAAALAAGTALIATVWLLERGVAGALERNSSFGPQNLYVLNVPQSQAAAVKRFLAQRAGVRSGVDLFPLFAVRVRKVNGVGTEHAERSTLRQSWFATWSDRQDAPLIAGRWWDRDNGSEVVLTERAARLLGASVGARLDLAVQGRTVQAAVVGITRPENRGILRYDLTLQPSAAKDLRTAFGGAVRCPPDMLLEIQRELHKSFPTVAMVDLGGILALARGIVGQLVWLLHAVAFFFVLAGTAVLASAVAATALLRQQEAAIFRALGATRKRIFAIFTVEFAALGAAAGTVGGLISLALARWLLARFFGAAPVPEAWQAVPAAILLPCALATAAGWLACYRPVFRKPLAVLRRD